MHYFYTTNVCSQWKNHKFADTLALTRKLDCTKIKAEKTNAYCAQERPPEKKKYKNKVPSSEVQYNCVRHMYYYIAMIIIYYELCLD